MVAHVLLVETPMSPHSSDLWSLRHGTGLLTRSSDQELGDWLCTVSHGHLLSEEPPTDARSIRVNLKPQRWYHRAVPAGASFGSWRQRRETMTCASFLPKVSREIPRSVNSLQGALWQTFFPQTNC